MQFKIRRLLAGRGYGEEKTGGSNNNGNNENQVEEFRDEFFRPVTREEARSLLLEAVSFYETLEPVLRMGSKEKILVVGDTHGALDVSLEAYRIAKEEKADLVVFVGDYVDRGETCVENLHFLLKWALEEPKRVILLRGNHESPMTNYYYGFYDEVVSKLGAEYYDYYRELFSNLPYIVVVNDWIMVHGGIACRECANEKEDPYELEEITSILERIKGKEENEEPGNPLAFQLLWNDPRGTIDWFLPSARGPGIYYFGLRAWHEFLEVNKLRGIIRGHEVADGFYIWLKNGEQIEPQGPLSIGDLEKSVITVFSSRYHGQSAGILVLTESTINPIRL